jgi:hypothetical protein
LGRIAAAASCRATRSSRGATRSNAMFQQSRVRARPDAWSDRRVRSGGRPEGPRTALPRAPGRRLPDLVVGFHRLIGGLDRGVDSMFRNGPLRPAAARWGQRSAYRGRPIEVHYLVPCRDEGSLRIVGRARFRKPARRVCKRYRIELER